MGILCRSLRCLAIFIDIFIRTCLRRNCKLRGLGIGRIGGIRLNLGGKRDLSICLGLLILSLMLGLSMNGLSHFLCNLFDNLVSILQTYLRFEHNMVMDMREHIRL